MIRPVIGIVGEEFGLPDSFGTLIEDYLPNLRLRVLETGPLLKPK